MNSALACGRPENLFYIVYRQELCHSLGLMPDDVYLYLYTYCVLILVFNSNLLGLVDQIMFLFFWLLLVIVLMWQTVWGSGYLIVWDVGSGWAAMPPEQTFTVRIWLLCNAAMEGTPGSPWGHNGITNTTTTQHDIMDWIQHCTSM